MSNLAIVLLIVVIALAIGAFPIWPYAAAWGNTPAGILLVALVVIFVLALTGRL